MVQSSVVLNIQRVITFLEESSVLHKVESSAYKFKCIQVNYLH